MIFESFSGVCHRAHDPRWAFEPLSGEGARVNGGRFNPVGTAALYLSLDMPGALLEAGGGINKRMSPKLICNYDVDVANIANLTSAASCAALGIDFSGLSCGWLADVVNGKKPASWSVAEQLIASGAAGILVPSFADGAAAGAKNLVLWTWGSALPYLVKVYDPNDQLPKNQHSWR